MSSAEGYCPGCGAVTGACRGCLGAFEAPRFCPHCGRRLTVRVEPTRWEARCPTHGSFDALRPSPGDAQA